jgi:hypothetical protein
MGNFPAGHPQRRWDADFTGNHAVTVVGGVGLNKWLDPLAPNRFTGDMVADATVTKFAANSGWFIAVRRDVFAPLLYTQAQMDAAMAACKAANVIAVNASYNSGLTAAAAAVSAVPRK